MYWVLFFWLWIFFSECEKSSDRLISKSLIGVRNAKAHQNQDCCIVFAAKLSSPNSWYWAFCNNFISHQSRQLYFFFYNLNQNIKKTLSQREKLDHSIFSIIITIRLAEIDPKIGSKNNTDKKSKGRGVKSLICWQHKRLFHSKSQLQLEHMWLFCWYHSTILLF